MKRSRRIGNLETIAIGAVVLVASLAACGRAPESGSGAGGSGAIRSRDPERPVGDTVDPHDRVPGDMKPRLVQPRPGVVDARPIAWERAEPSASGRAVTILYWSGVEPCNVLAGVEVVASSDSVGIRLLEGHLPANQACIEVAERKAVRVELHEPLDGRRIVDLARP